MDKREIRGQYERSVSFTREAVNEEARTVEIAISSEAAVERWFGLETLGHGKGEVNLARLSDGGAVLGVEVYAVDDVDHVEQVDFDLDAAVDDQLVVSEGHADLVLGVLAGLGFAHVEFFDAATGDNFNGGDLAGVVLLVGAGET